MVNKQNIWFVTLFSIILVLSIFYISINEDEINSLLYTSNEETFDSSLVINESTELVALRVQSDEEELETMNELKEIILSETTDATEKSDAYNSLIEISNNKGTEQELENLLEKEFHIDSYVKINGNNITIVIEKLESSYANANSIIRKVQEQFDTEKYITVKFN